jgi:trans-aconitate methyltransferase
MRETMSHRWRPEQYSEHAGFVADLGESVVELLAPRPGERILDLGCGDGRLTRRLSEAGCEVIGVDSSLEMVAAARQMGLDARLIDGHTLPFAQEFDAVFSNAALHWMRQPEQVIKGVWESLRPGGRFVGEFGGHGNISTVIAGIEYVLCLRGVVTDSPWFFPSAAHYRELLEAQGFTVHSAELFPRPTPLPTDLAGWLQVFAQPFLSQAPQSQWPELIAKVTEVLGDMLRSEDGTWVADYVRLRFKAEKPESLVR